MAINPLGFCSRQQRPSTRPSMRPGHLVVGHVRTTSAVVWLDVVLSCATVTKSLKEAVVDPLAEGFYTKKKLSWSVVTFSRRNYLAYLPDRYSWWSAQHQGLIWARCHRTSKTQEATIAQKWQLQRSAILFSLGFSSHMRSYC